MKRFALTFAALTATAIGTLAIETAHAQGRGQDQRPPAREGRAGGWERREGGGDRGPGGAWAPREARGPEGGRYRDYDRGPPPEMRYRDDRRAPPREARYGDDRRPPPEMRYGDDRRGPGRWEAPGPYDRGSPAYPAPYPRAAGVRPGGYLPPSYRGAPVQDYRRYRLRPPPHGYNWVRVGDGFALVSPEGQIFDMVR